MSDTIRILCSVAASFRLPDGGIFELGPNQRYVMLDAPAGIREDPLFNGLIHDGSLEIAGVTADTRLLENAPDLGVTADGKKPRKKPEAAEPVKTGQAV